MIGELLCGFPGPFDAFEIAGRFVRGCGLAGLSFGLKRRPDGFFTGFSLSFCFNCSFQYLSFGVFIFSPLFFAAGFGSDFGIFPPPS
ncbi:MAG: hypothetical protein LBP95_11805 [Deltaproteobacteria bacterium]|nr:hypothetical protein [Deltaproteobacteria bacterium]